MDKSTVSEIIYKRYIEPTKRKREKSVGIEIEMPIINLNKEAVDFDIVHEVTDRFIEHFCFDEINRDDEGNIYNTGCSKNNDILSYDCSYNNLELSLGKAKELHILNARFFEYYNFLNDEFKKFNYTLTGMGINPYRKYNKNVPVPNGRYRMLFHHLGTYKKYDLPMYFHNYPEYGTFSSASQVQLDVDYDDLIKTIDVFSKLEPIKSVLFSNSILLDEHEELLCCRDMFWENSTHGINPHNVGMFDCKFENVDELLRYIESTSMYCVERGDKYINFPPINVMKYFEQPVIKGEYFDGQGYSEIEFNPELDDIKYLRTFKFEDLTFRGTIEFRSVCCQPIKDSMTVAAFHMGLKEELEELSSLLDSDNVIYHNGYTATELRKMFNYRKMPDFVDEDALYDLVLRVLNLAKKGLIKRGYGEEEFLAPLYDRVRLRTNPSRRLLESKEAGVPVSDVIRDYA